MQRFLSSAWNTPENQTIITADNQPLSPHLPSSLQDKMAGIDTGVFAAIGAVLGYVGAEAATKRCLERMLWPQRTYSDFTLRSAPMLALLMPMGGPLHKVSLQVLDILFEHNLFRGAHKGHMLGTSIFPNMNWKLAIWGPDRENIKSEEVRNGLWIRALQYAPIPTLAEFAGASSRSDDSGEKGTAPTLPVHALVAVSHLTLTKATNEDKASLLPLVSEAARSPRFRTYVAIVTSELTAIGVAIGLGVGYRTLWSLWWLVPLILRLLSAIFALNRHALLPLDSKILKEDICNYEIHCPQSSGNFMLLTGPRAVVDQFFVHYGHPERSRFREIAQLIIIVLMGAFFPFGLFVSAIWMPLKMQYAWLCYQLYVILAMLVARYYHGVESPSTEAKIMKELTRNWDAKSGCCIENQSILFGHDRNDSGTIKASLSVTYCKRYLEGKACLNRLLGQPTE